MGQDVTVAVIGLGFQGARAVALLVEHGYSVVGAVDIGEKVGKPIKEVVGYDKAPDIKVSGSIEDLFANGPLPKIVIWSAAVPPPVAVEMTCQILARGVNVLTITEELFEGKGEMAERVDKVAKDNGVSIISTGLQDTFWVQLPAVLAGVVQNITRVQLTDIGDASVFSPAIAHEEAGIGISKEEYAEWREPRLKQQPIQGGPLRELARKLGFHPHEFQYQIEPILSDAPLYWESGEQELPAGSIIGTHYTVSFDTDEGVKFDGVLDYKLAAGLVTEPMACSYSTILIEGEQNVTLVTPNLPIDAIPLPLIRRIPELLASQPGLIRSSTLAPLQYQHPVA